MSKSKKINPNKIPLTHPFDYAAFMDAQFTSTDCPFRMSGADSSVETV